MSRTDPRPRPSTLEARRRAARKGLRSSRARFERRAAEVRRRPLRLIAILAAVVVAGLLAGWVVGFSPALATRTVTVTGLPDPGEREAVVAAAAIRLGTPLARVDTEGAAARASAIATVTGVRVSRSWPNTVTISVERKTPVIGIRNPEGQLQVAGADGVPYLTVPALPAGVALVNATTTAPDPEGMRAAISVLQLLSPAQRATVADITVSSADLVTLKLGATTVVWGGAADGPKKLVVLTALLPTKPSVIDVSAPDTPVTR